MDLSILILLSVLPVLVIAAGLTDLTTMTIPNWISLALIVAFFPAALLIGLAPMQIAIHLGVGLLALFVGAGLFALNWIGGGDAKLMAAASLWLGVTGSGMFLLWTGVFGGVLSLALIVARSQSASLAYKGPPWMERLLEPKGDIPYGVAIAAGALMAFPGSALMRTFIGG